MYMHYGDNTTWIEVPVPYGSKKMLGNFTVFGEWSPSVGFPCMHFYVVKHWLLLWRSYACVCILKMYLVQL